MPTSSCHSENVDNYINMVDNSDDIARVCDGAGLKVAYTNTDQLTNKIEEVSLFLVENCIDILSVCEVLPKRSGHDISSFIVQGYTCYSCLDGRGVCLFIRNNADITVVELNHIQHDFKPSLFVNIVTPKASFVLGVVYRSPSSSVEESESLNIQITNAVKYSQRAGVDLIVVGDFNYPEIDWGNESCSQANSYLKAAMFLENVHSNSLTQHIKVPTHYRCLQTPTLIDLLLTNDPSLVKNICHLPPFGMSHHSVITFNIKVDIPETGSEGVYKYQINKGNYNEFRTHLRGVKWTCDPENVDIYWENFHDTMKEGIVTFVPKKLIKPGKKHNKHSCPFIPGILHKVRLKRSAYKYYKKYPTTKNYNIYCKFRNQVKWETRKSVILKEKSIAKQVKTNPKLFYQYVSSKIKTRDPISNLKKSDGTLTTNNQEKADVLKSFFHSVFTNVTDDPLPPFEDRTNEKLSHLLVTESQMVKALQSLKVDKSPGPDGLHPRVLKEVANEIAHPLTVLFNSSISHGKIPKAWKIAEVKPIFKKGDKTSPGNYRPVSLTSIVCKVFESFLRDALYEHLVKNKLLSKHQFGFCKGRSCVSQLLVVIHHWLSCMDRDVPTDAIYLDLSKAFDTVPHKKLIHKLKGYGIGGSILDWISDFLSDRTQYVSVGNTCSESTPVTSGVPQGSVLGPILFIYYINDMPDVVDCFIKIFADDAKTSNEINSFEDSVTLQNSLDGLSSWTEKWGVGFNCDKCGVMHLGKNNPNYNYTLNNKPLNVTVSEKDLGVHVDPLLKFEDHIDIKVKKARQISGLIARTITYKSVDIMVPLYKSLVRPILEYGNVVWSSYLRRNIDLIEGVQKFFTKKIIGVKGMDYEDRLKFLKIPSLEFRRLRGDLIETYKLCNGLYDPVTTSSLFDMCSLPTRSNGLKITKINPLHAPFRNFFTNRVVNVWNGLPAHVVSSESTNSFKNHIDKIFIEYMYSTKIIL